MASRVKKSTLHARVVRTARVDGTYERLLAQQNGKCALCPNGPKNRSLDIDTDHRTMRIRGLLCHRCNRILPNYVSPAWLRAAADYLDAHAA